MIGAYAARLSVVDVWVMLIAGLFCYLLHVLRFPLAPMVLGVILAPLADENLRRALLIFEDRPWSYMASQWMGNLLALFILFVFLEGLWRLRSRKRDGSKAAT